LVIGARTGFLTAVKATKLNWQRVATVINMTAKSHELVDLGAAPMPTKDLGQEVQDFIEKNITVKPEDWSLTVYVSQNAIDDDQTGTLERRVRGAGVNFQKHIDKRVFTVLNAGDSTTYGSCYDGQDFFDSDHADAGADYQTNQDNENALAMSMDNFETVKVAAEAFKDDRGEYTNYVYDLIVCAPALERVAAQITGNPNSYDTGNREINPYSGRVEYITTPYYDSAAWHLVASNEAIKPIIVAMRKEPQLLAAWYDPEQPEGGFYYFKYHARYEMYYGDWRLVNQGNT
jgi:phage major head subunit gpT-like protein